VECWRPGGRPTRPPAVLQTPTDASEQNNTGPLGGPVTMQNYQLMWYHCCTITLVTSSGKHNASVWRPFVCLPHLFPKLNRARDVFFSNLNWVRCTYSPWLTRGQHATRPAYVSVRRSEYYEGWHTCITYLFYFNQVRMSFCWQLMLLDISFTVSRTIRCIQWVMILLGMDGWMCSGSVLNPARFLYISKECC